MPGTDPHGFDQEAAGRPERPRNRAGIDGLLDELQHLMEVLDPAPPDPARNVADRQRARPDRGR